MSTRANVIIKDRQEQLIFYRHSDGDPEVTGESLARFMRALTAGRIRDNASQAAGWLILMGHHESLIEHCRQDGTPYCGRFEEFLGLPTELPLSLGYNWKVGAYEPTPHIHVDIEFLYEIDLAAKTCKGWHTTPFSKPIGKKGKLAYSWSPDDISYTDSPPDRLVRALLPAPKVA